MRKLEVRFTRSPEESLRVGTLAEDRSRVYFEYAPEFLATGLNLSPIRLPFERGLFEHRDFGFGPLPGVFDDSLPDGWGLLLMDRHFRSLGVNLSDVSPLTRLSWLGACAMGALTYHPPAVREALDADIFDLHALARHSLEVLSGAAADVLPQLLRAGGSPGGARPKVLVGFNPVEGRVVSGEADLSGGYEHWIVKFPSEKDSTDIGKVEYAYSLMADAAGVDMPATRLFETTDGGGYFGVRRFDRDGNRRFHVHTFGGLLQSNFRIPSADYSDLLKAASFLTRNHQEVLRSYRRMVFNVAAHNRDDHVKNFAFILNDATGDWTLTPAYDLLPAPGPGGEHSMTILGEGKNPGRSRILQIAAKAGISKGETRIILDEVRSAVDRWEKFAERAGLSPKAARQIEADFPNLRG
ncbi:type II toxin-antitoxin system HipA family toxin [bacterium]|nr:type II toxin-antitoxin system HipA family toxin [bacterium]